MSLQQIVALTIFGVWGTVVIVLTHYAAYCLGKAAVYKQQSDELRDDMNNYLQRGKP